MEPLLRTTQCFHLDLLNFYHPQLREWSEGLVPQEAAIFKGHNFENSGSLLKVEIKGGSSKILCPNGMSQTEFSNSTQLTFVQLLKHTPISWESITIRNVSSPLHLINVSNCERPRPSESKEGSRKGVWENECSLNLLLTCLPIGMHNRGSLLLLTPRMEPSPCHSFRARYPRRYLIFKEPWRSRYQVANISRTYWKRSYLHARLASRHLQSLKYCKDWPIIIPRVLYLAPANLFYRTHHGLSTACDQGSST